MTAPPQRPLPIRTWAALAVFIGLLGGGSQAYGRSSMVLPVDSPEVDLHYPITDPPATGDNNTGTIDLATPARRAAAARDCDSAA